MRGRIGIGTRAAALGLALLAVATLQGCAAARMGRAGGEAHAPRKGAAARLDPIDEARLRAEEQPGEPWWPYRVAELESAAGRPAQAESALRSALQRDSSYAPALTLLSRTLFEQRRHEEARRLLEPVRERRVTLAAAERAAVLAGLALHEAALGRDAEAREVMEGLSRDERDRVQDVAAFLVVRGGSADSAAQLARAAREARESATLHNNRGIALLRAADVDGAQREFERAIALNPARAAPYYNLAILERWYRLDPDAAVKRFREYWSRSHADPDSLYAELGRGLPASSAEGMDR